jgi:hypothetical protein
MKFFIEILLVPPVLNDSLAQVKIEALINSTVTLLCSAYGFPKPSINWFYNTNVLSKPKREEELILEHIQVK